LGTEGAIVGDWNPAAEPAVADLPALLTIYREGGAQEDVTLDEVAPHAFHASLSNHLHKEMPMPVTALQSRNVVGIMQAAEESARQNGRPIIPALRLS
jgi:L-amino acid N-acyltransferase YncA